MQRKKVALLGGSFDPPHNGHVALILSLIEDCGFSEVVVLPNGQQPFKTHIAPAEARWEMAFRAFQALPNTVLCDYEVRKSEKSPCYTIDTVEYLQSQKHFSSKRLVFVMGGDCLSALDRWKEPKKLFEKVEPLIFLRMGTKQSAVKTLAGLSLAEDVQKKLISSLVEPTALFSLTSTDIRERLQKGLWVRHLIPHEIDLYIREKKLYTPCFVDGRAGNDRNS